MGALLDVGVVRGVGVFLGTVGDTTGQGLVLRQYDSATRISSSLLTHFPRVAVSVFAEL